MKLVLPWFILWGAISILIGYLWRKYIGERTIKAAEKRAKEIIQEAENLALSKKREIDLEAKELLYRLRSEFERETRNKRKELQFQEKRLQQREINLERKSEILEKKDEELSQRERKLEEKERELRDREAELFALIEEEKKKLESISGITREEAKEHLIKLMEEEARKEASKIQQKLEEEAREKAEKKAKEILLSAMQRLAPEEASESVVSVVSLPNDEIKGRIIGREGRNIRAFEALTGVDLIVDDTPEAVTISSFNLYRREIARISLEKLIADGRIHPGRIEEVVEKVKKEIDEKIIEEGNNTIFEVGIENVHPELVKLLGKLKYRTSYGQNALQHSKESAFLAGMIASELGLDAKLAKRAALFHDIGKAVDQEVEGSHPEIGAELLRKYGEREEVIDAALSHHKDLDVNSPYTVITQIADTLSATRPGARRDTLERYIRRIENLEKIASSFKGVDTAFAISAGREVRVIVKPDEVSDEKAKELAREIAKKIEANMEYIGQVKVTVIREKREIEYAK
ncbi:ribonuclease Y [bacterium]|nr:ribonuclease Y [bacterium]